MHRPFRATGRTAGLRRGFTLIEMLVAIGIILTVAAMVAPLALSILDGRSLREATGTVQAALAGGRDRAAAAGAARGVRLIPDREDPSLVRELRYIRQTNPISTGKALVVPAQWNAPWDGFTQPFMSGAVAPSPQGTVWPAPVASDPLIAPGGGQTLSFSLVVLKGNSVELKRLKDLAFYYLTDGVTKVYFGGIRLVASGQTLSFTTTDAMIGAGTVASGETYSFLRLSVPLARPIPYDASGGNGARLYDTTRVGQPDDWGDEYSIAMGNVELEGEEAVNLPAGVVLDLGAMGANAAPVSDFGFADRRLTRLQPDSGQWDVVFSPSGQVIGAAAGDAHIFLWLREQSAGMDDLPDAGASGGRRRMVRTTGSANHSVVAIAARTGRVGAFEPNFGTDPTMTSLGLAPTYSDATTAAGAAGAYWNPNELYRLYFNALAAPDGGETGL